MLPQTIGDAVEKFFATSNATPATVLAYRQGTDQLQGYFSSLRPLDSIGPAEADEYVATVRRRDLARATQSKRLQVVKRIFSRCLRWVWINRNPFERIKPGKQTNPERLCFIPSGEGRQIIKAVPDLEWEVIIALAPVRRATVPLRSPAGEMGARRF